MVGTRTRPNDGTRAYRLAAKTMGRGLVGWQPKVFYTTACLAQFLSWIAPASWLYLGSEGYPIGRNGTSTFMAVLVCPYEAMKVIAMKKLGEAAFMTPSSSGSTLNSVLEDRGLRKCLRDLRGDTGAL